jgi:tRNA threonylcarbamoyladenosine biosynthesis protein TsaB
MTRTTSQGVPQSDYRLLHPEKRQGTVILAMRTDKPEAELYLFDLKSSAVKSFATREEQLEQKSHFLPGAMRNPGGVSYRPKVAIKWQAHRELSNTIHFKIKEILNTLSISLDEIEGIVCFEGPGSFTGLRIGLSVANALAYSYNIPIVARSGEKWLETGTKDLIAGKNDKIALPKYDRPAATTPPRK